MKLKYIFILILTVLFLNEAKAQRKGFIGLKLGTSSPVGDFANADITNPDAGLAELGTSICLITTGYKFWDNIGIAGKIYTGINNTELLNNKGNWICTSLMIGPMYSIDFEHIEFEFDFKTMFGITSSTLDIPSLGETDGNGKSIDFELGIRYNLSKRWAFLMSFDYFITKAKFENDSQKMNTINWNFGLAYRLK